MTSQIVAATIINTVDNRSVHKVIAYSITVLSMFVLDFYANAQVLHLRPLYTLRWV